MISIIICTRNRADSLKRTIESVLRSGECWTVPWELLIVDNGSRDHTNEVATSFLCQIPCPVRLLHEPQVGKSYALNLGIRHAKGEYLLFTDDDALVTSDWLPSMFREFQSDGSIGILGGRTESFGPEQARQGVRTSQESCEFRWPAASSFVVGNNMGVRAAALNVLGEFDVHLGAGTRVGGAEETDLAYRILKAGYIGKYVPEALVYHDHRRSSEQVNKIRWNYAKGRGAFFVKHILRGDLYVLKMAYWNARSIIKNRNNLDPSVCIKDWKRLLLAEWVGAFTWLARL